MPQPRQRRATEGEPSESDWQAETVEALDAFAADLPSEAPGSNQALYDELTALFLHLAILAIERQLPLAPLPASGSPLEATGWPDLVDGVQSHPIRWLETEAASLRLLSACNFGAEALARLQRCARSLARRAQRGVDGPVRELGSLYVLLLGLSLEKLAWPAQRLRKSRAWLAPAAVLDWTPAVRAKRLKLLLLVGKHAEGSLQARLARATTETHVASALSSLFDPRCGARVAGLHVVQPSAHRRSRGAHYTPWPMCTALVRRTLDPITADLPEQHSRALLQLRICDPAMGAGAFLIASADHLATLVAGAWRREGQYAGWSEERLSAEARREVAARAVYGVDKDPTAVGLARVALSWFGGGSAEVAPALRANLRQGDALIGSTSSSAPALELPEGTSPAEALHWPAAFPGVFERHPPGFDAVLGNPPWVAYVGRAAQPLPKALAAYYAATNPAFRRYRTLHGLFVYRAATLLRRGGRLGLVLPTSVADLAGYSATRSAHDELCDVDPELLDFGDGAFEGVFQPSMALLSTRRSAPRAPARQCVWPLSNPELTSLERALLERARRLPCFPPEQFGERGFQTTRDDQVHLARLAEASAPYTFPLREGADIGEFRALPPRLFADPAPLGLRLRPPSDWHKVAVLIRQTARYPMAARADGLAFRNSILAGFASDEWSGSLLLCWLNSSLVRWLHYSLHRDARQGMPQLKIGHLRALPAPPRAKGAAFEALSQLGASLGSRNHGIAEGERARLDALVALAFELSAEERAMLERWTQAHPLPTWRRGLEERARASTGGPSGALEVAPPG